VLLLAAAGGVFGEGVEWPGSLAGVAVVGPCLPPPDLARELLRRRYEERFGDGFQLAYALPGMTRVIQGAGRLIRSERDRGVVALYGRRFLEEPWRSLLPDEWLAGGGAEDLVGDPAQVARAFFGAGTA
jgi:Rad3-related DNA helicase